MKDNVIYFPYIKVPKREWLTHVLFYWDKVYSIVPDDDIVYNKFYKDPDIADLVQNKLVSAATPNYYITHYVEYNDFKPLLDYLKNLNHSGDNFNRAWGNIFIHTAKLENNFLSELIDLGLARNKMNSQWVEVESEAGMLYMFYLAYLLGDLPQFNADTITDSRITLEYFNHSLYASRPPKLQNNYSNPLKDQTREIILRKILPVPAKAINADEIVKFKEKYYDELINFRKGLEEKIIDIANINDLHSREEKRNTVEEDAKSEIAEISEKMCNNGWTKIVQKNWMGLGASIAGIGYGAATGGVTPTTLFSTLGLIGTIQRIYREKIKKDKEILKNTFAYALLAEKEFINY